jgi:glutamine synthetase
MAFVTSPTRKSVGITKAALGLIQVDLASEGFGPSGEYFLMPDLSTLRTSTLEPRYASLMGNFEEKEGEKKEVDICPRTLLQRIVRYISPGVLSLIVL